MIGDIIKKARVLNGMTQRDLSDAIGSTQATISQYESGTRIPSEFLKRRIEKVLSLSFSDYGKESRQEEIGELNKIISELPDVSVSVLLDHARALKDKEIRELEDSMPSNTNTLDPNSIIIP